MSPIKDDLFFWFLSWTNLDLVGYSWFLLDIFYPLVGQELVKNHFCSNTSWYLNLPFSRRISTRCSWPLSKCQLKMFAQLLSSVKDVYLTSVVTSCGSPYISEIRWASNDAFDIKLSKLPAVKGTETPLNLLWMSFFIVIWILSKSDSHVWLTRSIDSWLNLYCCWSFNYCSRKSSCCLW